MFSRGFCIISQYSVHYILYTTHYTAYSVQCTVHFTLYIVYRDFLIQNWFIVKNSIQHNLLHIYNKQYTLYTIQYTMYTVQCTLYTVQCIVYTANGILYTVSIQSKSHIRYFINVFCISCFFYLKSIQISY